jgi:hypothetical protein
LPLFDHPGDASDLGPLGRPLAVQIGQADGSRESLCSSQSAEGMPCSTTGEPTDEDFAVRQSWVT